ncbi:hypothetical protein QCA50_008582 [Cerrena zonata]|uniref:Ribosome maturation protein SDO1/SBDS C-terminal domain-containing protein n=1 Tax=Cerrena zonata TaxID=2478898 RepID=A0AAW0GE50_9APHY
MDPTLRQAVANYLRPVSFRKKIEFIIVHQRIADKVYTADKESKYAFVWITTPSEDGTRLREKVIEGAEKIENDEMGQPQWEAIMLIDPGQFRVINDLLQKECKGRGRIETMTFAATAETN